MYKLSLVILFASICVRAGASVAVARQAEELLALEGDQTGTVIKIAPGYLPERWNEAVAIYAKGKPSFACPANLGVRSAGDGWWEVFRREMPHVFTWTGEGGDARWGNPRNWTCDNAARANVLVPGRLDTVRLGTAGSIKLDRDRAVSNLLFTAKVILAGGAIHACNTAGRGAGAKLGVRAWSCLGRMHLKGGAEVAPLRGTAGYRGVLQEDENGVARVALTRPGATFTWTGAGNDGKWANEKNWTVNGRAAVESPGDRDSALFPRTRLESIDLEMPPGLVVVSNLVSETPVRFIGAESGDALGRGGGARLDILDLTGNKEFAVRGNGVTVCIRRGAKIPISVERGMTLALADHRGRRYDRITLEDGAEFIPYDWPVEIETLKIEGANKIRFWPPRRFNRWRPIWMIHAQNLQGKPEIVTDDAHWGGRAAKLGDGTYALEIFIR